MNETWIAGGEHPLRFTPQCLSSHASTACTSPSSAASRTASGSGSFHAAPADEAAAAEEVAVATMVRVVGRCVRTSGAEQVVGDGLVLFPARGGGGGGAHVAMEEQVKKGQRGKAANGVKGGVGGVAKKSAPPL